jgi:hypothetical protein
LKGLGDWEIGHIELNTVDEEKDLGQIAKKIIGVGTFIWLQLGKRVDEECCNDG